MAINKTLLYEKIKQELMRQKHAVTFDLSLVLYLIDKTIFNDPRHNCVMKGGKKDWEGLPATKSLFHAKTDCGLPIGNLTSQLFGNVFMNSFDHWVKKYLGIKYYGRYVDDFILVHHSREYLIDSIVRIKGYLKDNLALDLHPDKIYLQHYTRGVKYLGAVIKPHRIYIADRTKGNFYNAVGKQNKIARDHKPDKDEQNMFLSSMNSYLGIMRHYRTYKLRKYLISKNLSAWWYNYAYPSGGVSKFVLKQKKVSKKDK